MYFFTQISRKHKIFLFSIFLILNILVYLFTERSLDSKIEYSKHDNLHELKVNYEIWEKNQATQADIIYDNLKKNSKVISLLSTAWHTKSEEKRDEIRNTLYKLLISEYKTFRIGGLLQYHFVFADNTVFLRMHKLSKYGDNLTGIRQDFTKVNRTFTVVRGFSEGKTTHAIRNVYPIFDQDNAHIGAVEISYPSELFQHKLNDMSEIHTHFLVKKSIFKVKSWTRNDNVMSYDQSMEHPDYMLTQINLHDEQTKKSHIMHLRELKQEIEKKIIKPKGFALFSKWNDEFQIISFYPIFQNTTGELAAWVVSYQDAPFIAVAYQDTVYARLISFIIILVLLGFMYKLIQHKNRLAKLLEAYDQNVIFSSTDKKGRITYVSSAFCEISGYSEKEFIGQSHNIVRHPDMPKKSFENMWKTITSGKTWKGEIKNLKKDGNYYWVVAEIEPTYDENKNIAGYIATRHDITDTKDMETLQKDIIFTMGSIGESRSKETANHVKRVAEYSKILALYYGLDEKEAEMLKMASPMHDIGKVGIPDSILQKPGALDNDEFEIMKTHVNKGYDMLKNSNRSLIKVAATIAYEHHEKYDGTGYPRGISGENIHIYGRITALTDVFDALSSDRIYKKAWEESRVLNFIREQRGKHFDPQLVDIFFEHYDEFKQIQETYKD